MDKNAELRVLERLLKSTDAEDREFAKLRLEELQAVPKSVVDLHKHAKDGTLDKLPAGCLTHVNILSRRADGLTVLHTAVEYGTLDQLPSECLTRENMLLTAAPLGTVFHWAAAFGNLLGTVNGLMTKDDLLLPLEDTGWRWAKKKTFVVSKSKPVNAACQATVLHLAALNRCLGQVNKDILTKEALSLTCATGENENVYDIAARTGFLRQIPDHLFTRECLSSMLHLAAKHGNLDQVPTGLLTEDNLLGCCNDGYNVYHAAAIHVNLAQLPKSLLTESAMLTLSSSGSSVLQYAAAHGELDQIPRSLLTEVNLMAANEFPSSLRLAVTNGFVDQLLGIEFSAAVEPIVGTKWFKDNLALRESFSHLSPSVETPEVELF